MRPSLLWIAAAVMAAAVMAARVLLAGPTEPARAVSARTGVVRLGGVDVKITETTRQVIGVNHTRGRHARIVLWRLGEGGWVKHFASNRARIGYGGLVVASQRRQGTGTTPIGTFRLPFTFGGHAKRAAWDMPYRRVDRDDYWVQDNRSAYYNRYRDRDAGGFRFWLPASNPNSSERLADYPRQYEFAVVIGFNYAHPVRHRGSGIFLHVNGRGATAGCVSAPRWFVHRVLTRLSPAADPVIAIGR